MNPGKQAPATVMARKPPEEQRFCLWLGRRIELLRLGRGWHPGELGSHSGVDRVFIRSIERGERNPTILTVAKLAQAFGLSPAELLTGAPVLLPEDQR